MRKTRMALIILAVLMLACLFKVNAAKTSDALEEIPYAKHNGKVSPYISKKTTVYSEEEARDAGVPPGYSGYVIELTGDSAMGFTVDFSDRKIPITTVKAIHMRVYYGTDQSEVRVSVDAGYSWVIRYAAAKPGTWDDVVISEEKAVKLLADENGFLGTFGFGFRNGNDTMNSKVYVDSITAEIFEGDGIPPVLTYNGPDHIVTTAGKKLVLDTSAWDEQEKIAFPVEYVWSGGALDDEGLMKEGEHSLILRATDNYGNSSEKALTVTVGPRDTEAPLINWTLDRIETVAGALPLLNFNVTDNEDEPETLLTWSDGAIDRRGRITEGTHTLTVTATDLTGNVSTVTVTVTASKGM